MTKTTKLTEKQIKAERQKQLIKFTDELSEWLSCGPVFIGQKFIFTFVKATISEYMKSRWPERLGTAGFYADMVISHAEQLQFDEMCDYRNI